MKSISRSSKCAAWLAIASIISSTSAQTVTGQLGNAITNTNNPAGAAYVAELRTGAIKGRILAIPAQDKGTEFSVQFVNMPTQGGPFRKSHHVYTTYITNTLEAFHLHVNKVPGSNNCTETLGHLDPFIRGETPACDASKPETCQVGDLAGKHGAAEPKGANLVYEARLVVESFQYLTYDTNFLTLTHSFTDPYVSLTPGVGAFFGNRSFVIHFANTTRITCANFEPVDAALAQSMGFPGPGPGASPSGMPGFGPGFGPSGGGASPSGFPGPGGFPGNGGNGRPGRGGGGGGGRGGGGKGGNAMNPNGTEPDGGASASAAASLVPDHSLPPDVSQTVVPMGSTGTLVPAVSSAPVAAAPPAVSSSAAVDLPPVPTAVTAPAAAATVKPNQANANVPSNGAERNTGGSIIALVGFLVLAGAL